jgi:flagellar biosynthesis protein FlhB
MAKPANEQTEEPTAKRRLDARQKGEAARSTELPQSITLIAAVLILIPMLTGLWGALQRDTVSLITTRQNLEAPEIGAAAANAMRSAGMTLVPMLTLIVLVSVVAQVAIAGLPNVWKLKPKFDGLNPQKGLKRVFSKQQLWELARTIMKLALLLFIGLLSWSSLSEFVALGPAPLSTVFSEWSSVVQGLSSAFSLVSPTPWYRRRTS